MFPLTNLTWTISVILFCIMVVPAIAQKIRFPYIAGLILAGMIIGPGCLNIIEPTPETSFLSQVGLLFIMFFAGLDVNTEELKKNTILGISFGLLTFIIPWVLCYITGKYLLGLSNVASGVMACILASHTLISYPIISRYGQTGRLSVTISIAGSLIAISLALIVYAVLQSIQEPGTFRPLFFALNIIIYIGGVLLICPRLAQWYFRAVKNSHTHFLFVLLILAVCCGLAEMAGLSNILGAFLAGLTLNRYIPKSSPLMNRLDFTGNTIFIPFFLLNTGMLIHLRDGLLTNYTILWCFVAFLLVGTASKWLVSFIIQKAKRLDKIDRWLIFGLSSSHAAGALAIAMGGIKSGLFDNDILGSIVLIVLFSCIIGNMVTEKAAIILHKSAQDTNSISQDRRIMVSIGSRQHLNETMSLATMLYKKGGRKLVGLYITIKGDHREQYMKDGQEVLEEALKIATSADVPFVYQNRLGNNLTESLIHASDEFTATDIIMGLPDIRNTTLHFYDNIIRPVIEGTTKQVILSRFTIPTNTIRKIIMLVPGPVKTDAAFETTMETLCRMTNAMGCGTEIYGKEQAVESVRSTGNEFSNGKVSYYSLGESADMNWVLNNIRHDNLLLIVAPRESESHASRMFMHLYERLHLLETQCSLMIIYPESTQIGRDIQESTERTGRDLLKMLRV